MYTGPLRAAAGGSGNEMGDAAMGTHGERIRRRNLATAQGATPASRRQQPPGFVYLIHFERPYQRVKHHMGWCEGPVAERFALHLRGQGGPLTRAVVAAGIGLQLVRTWEGTRELERALRRRKAAIRLCPICSPGATQGGGDAKTDRPKAAGPAREGGLDHEPDQRAPTTARHCDDPRNPILSPLGVAKLLGIHEDTATLLPLYDQQGHRTKRTTPTLVVAYVESRALEQNRELRDALDERGPWLEQLRSTR